MLARLAASLLLLVAIVLAPFNRMGLAGTWRRAGFEHDPLSEWVTESRGLLVRACLVLVRASLAAGRPRGRARLGSFES